MKPSSNLKREHFLILVMVDNPVNIWLDQILEHRIEFGNEKQ